MQASRPGRNCSFSFNTLRELPIAPTTFPPDMRTLLPSILSLAVLALPACRCSPANPVPITMRVVNGSRAPIYVDGRNLGLTVKRDVGGQLFAFDDQACECLQCTRACDPTCTCPDGGVARVQQIATEATKARPWDGVVLVSGSTSCTDDHTCHLLENAPLNEPFDVELCYSNQRPGGMVFDDAGVGLGLIPQVSLTCVNKTFMIQDEVVEIGPERGAACATTADCKGKDELCFDGACTAGCPANDYPQAAGGWDLKITVNNREFFTQTERGGGQQYQGTGTITSASFSGSSFEVDLARPGVPVGTVTGQFTLTLPPGYGPPLQVGAQVSVLLIEGAGKQKPRSVVVRDATTNVVLLAAETAQPEALLTAAELAPFSTTSGATPIGCVTTDCGRLLFFERTFSVGASSVTVSPGKKAKLTLSTGTWSVLSVSDGAYATTTCNVSEIRPWVLWREL
jgi:hypothetical protein